MVSLKLKLMFIVFFILLVKIKWGQECFDKVEVDTEEEPMLFKAQLFALTGVQPHRQKVMLKGALLKDDSAGWDALKPKLKNGATLLMMGTKDEDALVTLKESEKPQVMEYGAPFTGVDNYQIRNLYLSLPNTNHWFCFCSFLRIWTRVSFSLQ